MNALPRSIVKDTPLLYTNTLDTLRQAATTQQHDVFTRMTHNRSVAQWNTQNFFTLTKNNENKNRNGNNTKLHQKNKTWPTWCVDKRQRLRCRLGKNKRPREFSQERGVEPSSSVLCFFFLVAELFMSTATDQRVNSS